MKNILLIVFIGLGFLKGNAQIEKPVKWSYAAKKINNTEAVLYIKADIESPWHIYSVNQPDGGPVKTSFEFKPSKDFVLIGKVIEPNAIRKHEEVFDIDVLYFEKSVVFQQKVKLMKPSIIKGSVEFMACTDERCLPAEMIEFSIPIQ